MLPVPDPDTLLWMALAAAGGVVLAVALGYNQAYKWLVFSSEADSEPEIDIPDTREDRRVQLDDIASSALTLALGAAAVVYAFSLPDALQDVMLIGFAALFMLKALANWLTQDDRAPVVGEAQPDESDNWSLYSPLLLATANLALAWFS